MNYSTMIRWFPFLILLSTLAMPMIMDLSILPRLIIPMMALLWALVVALEYDLFVPKPIVWLIGLLFLSQTFLIITGEAHTVLGIPLGFVWILSALFLWSMMWVLKEYYHTYASYFLFFALIWAGLGLYVWLGFSDGSALHAFSIAFTNDAQGKPTGPFANGNVLGILMLCAWVISCQRWLTKGKYSTLFGILSFIFLVLVFTSMSRGVWISSIFIVAAGIRFLTLEKRWNDFFILLIMAVLAWFVASYLVDYVNTSEGLADRAERILNLGARRVLYPAVFEVWKSHWMQGVGFGNLSSYFFSGQAAAFDYLPEGIEGMGATLNAHNHLLHILSEAGLIGFIIWVTVSFALFKSLWETKLDIQNKAWLPLNLALVLWVQGLINISMFEPLPFMLFFIFLGAGMALQGEHFRSLRVPSKALLFLTVVTVLVLGSKAVDLTKNWILYERMYYATSGKERGPIVKELLPFEHTFPRVILQVILDFDYRKVDADSWISLQPLISKAIYREQWAILYRGLFYSYIQSESWDKACQTGRFILKQHWSLDKKNKVAYERACHEKTFDRFFISEAVK